MTGKPDLARALALGEEPQDLDAADLAMLRYAVKLTHTPGAVDSADVEALRSHGFDDRGILDVCQVVSYYNYVNRLADGVGVEMEDHWAPADLIVTRDEMPRVGRRRGP